MAIAARCYPSAELVPRSLWQLSPSQSLSVSYDDVPSSSRPLLSESLSEEEALTPSESESELLELSSSIVTGQQSLHVRDEGAADA